MKYINLFIILALMELLLTVQVPGQEQGGLVTKLSFGTTLTDGNSDTMQANASLVTEGEKDGLGSLRAGLEAAYGETTTSTLDDDGVEEEATDTTIENARIFAGAKKTITDYIYGSVDSSVLYDDIAGIDYRATLSPSLGLYVIKGDIASLSVDLGPAYIWEKVSEVEDDYLAIRFGERAEYKFSGTAKAWQTAEYLPKADDFVDYLLNIEVGVEAALNSHLNLRLVFQNKHDSTPGEGLERNDLVLIGGISVTL